MTQHKTELERYLTFEMVLSLERSGVPYSQHRHYAALLPSLDREIQQSWNYIRLKARMAGEYIPKHILEEGESE